MGTLLTLFATLVVLIPIGYMYTASVVMSRFPMLREKRICLLIAHPDDEAMFFAPTVLALTRPEAGNHVKILCLSSGNADGLGAIRREELVQSALTLGLRHESDVFIVESPDFQDSMTTTWDADKIAILLTSTFAPGLTASNQTRTKSATATIDVLLTFDAGGVSGHPNHISLYWGARRFLTALTAGRPGWRPPVDLYTLTSVSLLRKFTSMLDVLPTLVTWFARIANTTNDKAHPDALVFLAGLQPGGGLTTAWRAMTTAHKSQMVWFRYGWITLSRYMVVNDLRLERGF
ncbi:N-acetylglucosaminyl-phosphatidylinositol de-N-acetylase [Grosmannia clavigera kw1407]|uniref:N-acetylglucosaminylphosphatidylinositol deacetylase n=1 Tax=Grosmannia clavigera (strain kw1407 / UAMH 11150) TaxID=655863 RepID=F0XR22_GROCL|nr:N-acetylglucosaminyl-phosphatidylinositol de-N-acetylase [Grosmannia clavigera kw1407]EFW99935.1 N-acetylglucosaminyl-phosphatidylinositol de-N-acetylase [Grosmannia clavigera kw1407]